ncbi:ArsR/SmtB family transcription factor [Pseudalkalibacillus berkeleyi]|uniref:Metalloregulator ArsR/SmtB family transcription factor n=1 Tax=Pseudalkalibacillus berkeleyi TaxID=1069813 RepID=A0ABS9H0V7_9BACL|nr:metalloregulator ArsR/SmtB family transcription factor [Pseudalkalibacillus berkeleyi]MCF6138634.1 metalloregulator ArsR/SmtB family transcription factor [Pseudalkalibacillus berkeleyi]
MKETALNMTEVSQTVKLLGDKTRLTIMGLLNVRECCVCEFVEIIQMSQPSISQHLRKLRDARLVKETRKGQWIYYSINQEYEGYPLVKDILNYVPDSEKQLEDLEKAGLSISCT